MREPAAFLFDEPLSNLDAALRVGMRLEISELHERLKTTMIYVTHDQVEAMTMADKIVVLHAGVNRAGGLSPLELYRTPRNRFVAGFIGSPRMNFLEGPEAAKHEAQTIGIRPEHITPVAERGHVEGSRGRCRASRLGHVLPCPHGGVRRSESPCARAARWTCTTATRST